MSWLLSLVPLARGAPAVGSCALQVSQTRFEPLIKYGLERRDAWQAEDGGCEGPELYRDGSVVRVPLAARAGRAAQASAAHEALQELRALEAQRWSQEVANFSLFNPTLLPLPSSWKRSGEERWLASFRHNEYTAHRDAKSCAPTATSTVILLAVLDQELRPTRPVELVTYGDLFPHQLSCQDPWKALLPEAFSGGPEDARLLALDDGVFMVFTVAKPLEALGVCPEPSYFRMAAAEIAPDLRIHGHRFLIRMESEVESELPPKIGQKTFSHYEKNWSPFVYRNASGEHLMVQQAIEPHVVLSMDHQFIAGREVFSSSSEVVAEWLQRREAEASGLELFLVPKIHGGVSPLLIEEPMGSLSPPFYLSVLHLQAMPVQGMARYKSFLFAFEAQKPFRLLGVGERGLPLVTRPSVFHLHVAFVDQMLWEKGRLVLFYGVGDARAQYLELSLEELRDYL